MGHRYVNGASRRTAPREANSHRLPVLDEPPLRLPLTALEPAGFAAWLPTADPAWRGRLARRGDTIVIAVGEGRVTVPPTAGTREGFCEWAASDRFPPHGRFSFLGSEIWIDMSPEELQTHNQIKTKIVGILTVLNEELDIGQLYSDRTLVEVPAADLATEPDGCLVRWESLESNRVRLVPRRDRHGEYMRLSGPPDWVLEVVSRYSFQKDTRDLRQKYERGGVAEYWLVNPLGDALEFKILARRRSRFAAVRPRDGWLHSPVFGRDFRLERRPHRLGLWRYTLHVRAAGRQR